MKRVTGTAALLIALATPGYADTGGASESTLWIGAGVMVFAAGLIVLFGIRQGYNPPPHPEPPIVPDAPPDPVPPAIAGALAAGGRPSLEHAAATLLVLADRGALRVEESDRRTLGTRTYHLTRHTVGRELAPHEQAVLAAVYRETRDTTVTLARARHRLFGRLRGFARAVNEELDAANLIDHERQRIRFTYLRVMLIEFVLALGALAAWPFLIETQRAWPVAVFMGLAAAGLVALLAYGTTTPLSNEGVERGRQWRAYRKHLKALARQQTGAPAPISLAHIVALGVASEWSKRLKQHPTAAPSWFQSNDGPSAYAMFIAAAGAGAHGNSPPHHAH
jgi:hypothetical protein